ncbi:hypothetical protein [Microbacterium karelineae]|uniref:hypothetical protein n=1 Tax=Microbacterium karelineae TaxID=2654283 RepID=UPI0012EAE20C|nr:hypothetical protein [Microbacterium karelineae]
MLRTAASIAALALAAVALTSCASEPEPEWTEEEAYAAAEETFRGYWSVDAFSDDEEARAQTLEHITGDLRDHYDGDSVLDGHDVQARGESIIREFETTEYRTVGDQIVVEATACIDDSAYELNIDGKGWKVPREDPIYGVELTFESVDSKILISHFDETELEGC